MVLDDKRTTASSSIARNDLAGYGAALIATKRAGERLIHSTTIDKNPIEVSLKDARLSRMLAIPTSTWTLTQGTLRSGFFKERAIEGRPKNDQ